jgi:hypothetical protein
VQAVRTQIGRAIADHAKKSKSPEEELGDRVRASPHFAQGVASSQQQRKPDYR